MLKANYPTAKIGIPGHGNTGDVNLLDYTINLFKLGRIIKVDYLAVSRNYYFLASLIIPKPRNLQKTYKTDGYKFCSTYRWG